MRTGQIKARAGSVSSRGSSCRFTTWSLKGVVGTLGTQPGWGVSVALESAGPNSRHDSSTKNACRSLMLLTEAIAVRSRVFKERNFNSNDCKCSKGAVYRALSTNTKIQADPSSEESAWEGLLRGACVPGTRSCWANMEPLTGPTHRSP